MSSKNLNASGGRIRRLGWFRRSTTVLAACGLVTATAVSAHGSMTAAKASGPRTAPRQPAGCPQHTQYVFVGARGVVGPQEDQTHPPHEVDFIRDNVIPEVSAAVGSENLTVRWLQYKPPLFTDTFLDDAVVSAVGNASRGSTPTSLIAAPDGLDRARDAAKAEAIAYIKEQASCPSRRFILAGHSLGAWALGEALSDDGLKPILPRVDEVLLWGDPMFDSSAPAARRPGSGPPKAVGIAAQVLRWSENGLVTSGLRSPYLPSELDDRSQSYCWGGPGSVDPVCATFEQPKAAGSTGQPVSPQQWAQGMRDCGVQSGLLRAALKLAPNQLAAVGQALGNACGHLKYTGGYARTYTEKIIAEGGFTHPVPSVSGATVTVDSTASNWRDTSVSVKKGQKVKITYLSGSWTVDKDNTHLDRVGPVGYPATTDAESPQCKLDEHLPYGQMVGGVEEFRSPVTYTKTATGEVVGTFTAPADGTVSLTINDSCRDNNAGLITVRVEAGS